MGFLFGLLIKVALPEELLGGHDSPYLKLLDILVPYAVATGKIFSHIVIDCEAREIMHLVASVRPSVCPFVCALTAELFDLRPSSFAWGSTLAR